MGLNVVMFTATGSRDVEGPGAPDAEGEVPIGASAVSTNSPTGVAGKYFRLHADADCRYLVATSGAATATSPRLSAGQTWIVGPLQGDEVVSVIQA